MTDIQNLNESVLNVVVLARNKIEDARLLISYQKLLETDPLMRRLYLDLQGAHISATTAINNFRETLYGKPSTPSTD